jgi:hypothetical protein
MFNKIPYTYFVLHVPTGLKYYGSKYGRDADPDKFWTTGGYFTSSVKVKQLILEYGVDSFNAVVRKKFKTAEEALEYEYRFLKKVGALKKDDWLNKNMGGKEFKNVGPASEKALESQRNKKQTPEGNRKRSEASKGIPKSEKTRHKMKQVWSNRSIEDDLERRDKLRKKATGRGHSEDTRKELSKIVSETRWINNGVDQKKIHKDDLEHWLSEGWNKGRILEIVTCPHCGSTGVKHNIVRRHFDKCVNKKS